MAAPANYMLLMVSSVLRGLGEAPFYGCIFTMIADTIEYGHWHTGVRVHALLFSAFTVGQKLGGGVAAWAIGQLMEASGFTGPCGGNPLRGQHGAEYLHLGNGCCVGRGGAADAGLQAG